MNGIIVIIGVLLLIAGALIGEKIRRGGDV